MVVYPRWRGELDRTASVVSSGSGLSPLARGARHSQADPATALRFIPAGAGNTPASSVYSARSPVYPRWRGEHRATGISNGQPCGLSPLARGTPPETGATIPTTRFIPAGAGNSCCSGAPLTDSPVYPRWRGELINPPCAGFFVPGLSPLARGTLSSAQSGN